MLVLNYSHPLTSEQLEQLAAAVGVTPEERIIAVQIDHSQPLEPQIAALVDGAGLSSEEWQRRPLLINLPGLASAAACIIAEIHGRTGHFPALMRLRPVVGSIITSFEVAELINLQLLRDSARSRRFSQGSQ
jgi:transposase